MSHAVRCLGLAIALTLGGVFACASGPARLDPLFSDSEVDADDPAGLWEGAFASGGERLNAIAYEAAGAGPHPTAILLHGFPGNERNLDLAQTLRRAGWNVVFFHYRGAWGSGGAFSFANAIDDVHAVVSQVREPAWAAGHRVDPGAIALVGHSMGGFAALVAGAENADVVCIAALAAPNLGVRPEPDAEEVAVTTRVLDGWLEGRIEGTSGAELVQEIGRSGGKGGRFDVLGHAPALAPKPVLLVSGARDQVVPLAELHEPLVDALTARDARNIQALVLDADHSFSSKRIALARSVAGFLNQRCVSSR